MQPSNMSPEPSAPHRYQVGDRVRLPSGETGVITVVTDDGWHYITKDNGYPVVSRGLWLTHARPMSQPARTLLAAWHASNRTLARIDRPNSPNRANINWGMARRRYCTPDGSIDLTITTAVK